MLQSFLPLFALAAGAAIATQVSLNARLGVLLDNTLIGTTIAFACSAIFTLLAVVASTRHYPQAEAIRSIPVYLWFSGSVLSAFGVASFLYLVPKMGVGPMMSYALTGQIIIAVIASHFGWLDLPAKPINVLRFAGMTAMIIGILLINYEQ